ncbi:cytidine deaminase [Candidatus Woesearchaeota archaeon]|jgi:cytidine deaminase|nr:cytidine deaminase [Candidatus Woesearchaeota archaeon]MBT4150980.1 cytidine deaminase [Candidatus Woesearchaeota archaeon]MBT4247256.1 cytidine deaminase [Candidatus Woesearchaeota archaeon]MBT4433770.1 cytidine deaminase [Candidatus Woesearchaeota archaeon]MBT7331897.1 cytidine deaminase [Candidatus Woesearchaeota archaeon]
MKNITYKKLSETQRKLLDAAEKAMKTAYNPYSHFLVGAALLSENGKTFTGSNVENAGYSSTICAERSAIVSANAKGVRVFDKVAIIARGDTFDTKDITSPCGVCRQMLFELAQISGKDLEVIMSSTKKDKIVIATIKELLPLGFGPKDIFVDVKKYR